VRWGGDEFGVILPRTHVHEALIMAERMRARIAELAVDAGEGRRAQTTISVGVAVNMARESTTDLIGRADRAMYAAKQHKNLVIIAV
jgi:diguanylate cyclase (GGDEF)-like protein